MPPSDDRSRRIGRERQRAGRMTVGLAAAVCLLLGAMVFASGQGAPPAAAKTATPPVALSFTEFHGYASATDYLKKVAAAYPGITDLVEIGRSQSGRPIYVLVVSTMKTGVTIERLITLANPRKPAVSNVTLVKPYQGKPAQWIDGGTHGATLAGTEVCLYIIEKLVSGYGSDTEITRLVDDSAFYICPMVHPDGGVEAGKPAPRAETASTVNGNYPEGWWKDDNTPGGTGDFPSSSPEARAVLEFFTNHTNILLAQSFHTSGGYTLRPFARWPDSRIDPRDAAVFDRVLGRKYLELIGEPVPASWTEALPQQGGAQAAPRTPGQPVGQGGRRGGVPGAAPAADQPSRRGTAAADQPRAWRSAYSQERQEPGGYGVFADWAYGQFGAYTMSTQLWDSKRDTKAVPGDGLAALCETHWQFERFKATLLPHVEIAEVAAKLLYTTSQASKATATQSGDAVLIRKAGPPGRYKVVQITATIANTGSLPTQVAQGAQLRGNREDVIWLLGDPTKITFLEGTRWMRLGVLQGTLPLPAAAGPAAGVAGARGGGGGRGGFGAQANQSPLAQMRQQRPDAAEPRQTGNRRVVSWLVAVEGDTPLRLAVTSQKGGTRVKDLVIQ